MQTLDSKGLTTSHEDWPLPDSDLQSTRCSVCSAHSVAQLLSSAAQSSYDSSHPITHQSTCLCSCEICMLMKDLVPRNNRGYKIGIVDSVKLFLPPNKSGQWLRFKVPRWFYTDNSEGRKYIRANHSVIPVGCFAAARELCADEYGVEVRKLSSRIRVEEFGIVRDWLQYCNKHHAKCSIHEEVIVPHMRLIDCLTDEIVPAELGFSYTALSYVWGTCHSTSTTPGLLEKLPRDVPKTIQDAVDVTLKLGIRYLWVDRYCIRQDNEEERGVQIAFMNRIYEKARVTLIDAAGSGPEDGLRGVSRERSPGQRVIHRCYEDFVEVLPGPISFIKDPPWNRRGWTFQEGEVSRRRLFFTPEQLFFQCREFSCCECFDPVHGKGFGLNQLADFRVGKFYTDTHTRTDMDEDL